MAHHFRSIETDKRRVGQLVNETKQNALDTMDKQMKPAEMKFSDWTNKHIAASTLLKNAQKKVEAPWRVHFKKFETDQLTVYIKNGSNQNFFVFTEEDYTDKNGKEKKGAVKYIPSATVTDLCAKRSDFKAFCAKMKTATINATKKTESKPAAAAAAHIASSSSSTAPVAKKHAAQSVKTEKPEQKSRSETAATTKSKPQPPPTQSSKKKTPTSDDVFSLNSVDMNKSDIGSLRKLLSDKPPTFKTFGKDTEMILHEHTTAVEIVTTLNQLTISTVKDINSTVLFKQPLHTTKLPLKKRASETMTMSVSSSSASSLKKRKTPDSDVPPRKAGVVKKQRH